MSMFLRALPTITLRSKPLSFSSIPLLYLNSQTLTQPRKYPSRTTHSVSAFLLQQLHLLHQKP
ncbi:hypothetical protein ACSBR1_027698 [Camellia fascicularis]